MYMHPIIIGSSFRLWRRAIAKIMFRSLLLQPLVAVTDPDFGSQELLLQELVAVTDPDDIPGVANANDDLSTVLGGSSPTI